MPYLIQTFSNLPNHILLVKVVVAHQKVITSFNKALVKNQACNNDV
jgi:hypothetical protein